MSWPKGRTDYFVMDARAIDDPDSATVFEVCETLAEAKRRAPEHGDMNCVFSCGWAGALRFVWQHNPGEGRGASS